MDLYAHEFGQFLARSGADGLYARAALAKHNGALAVAFDQYLLVDFDAAIGAFDIFFGLDRARIRQFIVQLQIKLLARDFGSDQTLRCVRNLILGEMPSAFRIAAAIAAFRSGRPSAVVALI